jgi:hypothetical protein
VLLPLPPLLLLLLVVVFMVLALVKTGCVGGALRSVLWAA